jgi:hypothetical protein
MFWCHVCGLQYNPDWNAAINIGSVFFATWLSRQATKGLAHAAYMLTYKPASPEAESSVDTATSTL